MISLEALASLALMVLLANSALQLILMICWVRLERPPGPLLKPVTLCAAVTTALRSTRTLLAYARHVFSSQIPGHLDPEQIVLKTTEGGAKSTCDYSLFTIRNRLADEGEEFIPGASEDDCYRVEQELRAEHARAGHQSRSAAA